MLPLVEGLAEFVGPIGGAVEVVPFIEDSAGRVELAVVVDDLAEVIEWRTGRCGEFLGSCQTIVGDGEDVGGCLDIAAS